MRQLIRLIVMLLIIGSFVFSSTTNVTARQDLDNDGILDTTEQQLASKYEPVLHFAVGELFFPTDVNYHIENSELYMKIGDSNTLIQESPTATSIGNYTTEDYFLSNTLGGFEQIAHSYQQNREHYGDKIYAHVTREAQFVVVQYWFFYAFNPGTLNQHQGDWEMIEIILDSNQEPVRAVYSQHHTGEIAEWKDVEKTGDTHPRVYVALGSHANYFRSFQGKLGTESDIVGNAYTLKSEDLQIITLGEKGTTNHLANQNWLEFGGRWGSWNKTVDAYIGSAGPSGPGQAENSLKWSNPVSWANDTFAVNQTWFTASFFVYYLVYIFVTILGIIVIIKIWMITKKIKNGKFNIMKILHSKAVIGVILGIIGIMVYFIALFLPWYVVTGDIQTTMVETAGKTELVLIDGINGLRVNTLQSNQGLTTLFGIGIPFSILFLSSVVLTALNIIGAEKPKNISKTYIKSGISSLVPLILIIGCIIGLTALVTSFAGALTGGQPIPQQVTELTSAMSASPFTGRYTDVLNSSGNIEITWGLGIGSYLFIVASAINIVAGIMLRQIKVPEIE